MLVQVVYGCHFFSTHVFKEPINMILAVEKFCIHNIIEKEIFLILTLKKLFKLTIFLAQFWIVHLLILYSREKFCLFENLVPE